MTPKVYVVEAGETFGVYGSLEGAQKSIPNARWKKLSHRGWTNVNTFTRRAFITEHVVKP